MSELSSNKTLSIECYSQTTINCVSCSLVILSPMSTVFTCLLYNQCYVLFHISFYTVWCLVFLNNSVCCMCVCHMFIKVPAYTHTYTHTHPFNGSFSRTTRVSRYQKGNKKLSYRRGTARCVVSIEILPIATQQCRNYLYDKS